MFKDTQFVITFQLALIGVVLIGGLFLIWKAMTRLEEKIDILTMEKDCQSYNGFKQQLEKAFNPVSEEEVNNSLSNDEVMQKLFGDTKDDFVVFSCEGVAENGKPCVKVEEVEEKAVSEVSEALSKNKLRTMNLEKLKKICEEKNLSTEGTKNQLIDRILQE